MQIGEKRLVFARSFNRLLFTLSLLLSLGIAVLAWVGLGLTASELWLEADTFLNVIQTPPRFREVSASHVFSEILQTLWGAKVHLGMMALGCFLTIFSVYHFVKLEAQPRRSDN